MAEIIILYALLMVEEDFSTPTHIAAINLTLEECEAMGDKVDQWGFEQIQRNPHQPRRFKCIMQGIGVN